MGTEKAQTSHQLQQRKLFTIVSSHQLWLTLTFILPTIATAQHEDQFGKALPAS
jgi:hypothetical protein